MEYTRGKLVFFWDPERKEICPLEQRILYENKDLRSELWNYLPHTNLNLGHPLRTSNRIATLHPRIQEICNDVFDSIKIIKNEDKNNVMAACLATRLFEFLGGYWSSLLNNGKHVLGIGYWRAVLDICLKWESENQIHIHKGTPYFFLAENYLLLGDKDNGFVYMHNAIQDDVFLPELNYPKDAPVFATATMLGREDNHMYFFIVKEVREKLSSYIDEYNDYFNENFTIEDFDEKFLMNDDYLNLVYFFTYNFFHLHDLQKHISKQLLQNEFTKIRTLDLVFNLATCIDGILKLKSNKSNFTSKKMYDSIKWYFCIKKKTISEKVFYDFVINILNLNERTPDEIVPIMLSNFAKDTNNFRKELHVILLAYHLRNHGGHNLDAQNILASHHHEILNALLMALFLAINIE